MVEAGKSYQSIDFRGWENLEIIRPVMLTLEFCIEIQIEESKKLSLNLFMSLSDVLFWERREGIVDIGIFIVFFIFELFIYVYSMF